MAAAGFASSWAATPDSVAQLDAKLAELARNAGRTRLALGELLEALGRAGGHRTLGFSSFAAYAREQCGRSGRWAAESRTLAGRLASLPKLRMALASGELGWCMVELLARHATPRTEALLVARARQSTVREMRKALTTRSARTAQHLHDAARANERCTLTLTLSQRDNWLFEWTRRFAEHVQGPVDMDECLSMLLAESFETLCGDLPANDIERCITTDPDDSLERAWRTQLAEWREESERRCEANFSDRGPGGSNNVLPLPAPPATGARSLDARIRALSAELCAHEVELARAALAFHAMEGALRLGYSTEAQYARERLGLSHASFKAKVALARRSPQQVQRALERREIGHEATLLISRIATVTTAEAWIARARERTVKHLAEEVRAAELVRDTGGPPGPPDDATLRRLQALEARLLAGDRAAVIEAGSQLSARTLERRLRVTRDTARFYRSFESAAKRILPRSVSFMQFICDVFWDTWSPLCGGKRAYDHIYARDRYTCSCPVCSRRDVTPHHIRFRSMGGDDSDENVTALCTWCHLEGVHGGRIRVTGKASRPSWSVGPLRVVGRRVIR